MACALGFLAEVAEPELGQDGVSIGELIPGF